jgi:hypothetical protein
MHTLTNLLLDALLLTGTCTALRVAIRCLRAVFRRPAKRIEFIADDMYGAPEGAVRRG